MNELINWTNINSGFLTLLIFVIILLFGWMSGIFNNLRHRPKFIIDIIPDPTFCSVLKQERYIKIIR
jgi:hypothetical protein